MNECPVCGGTEGYEIDYILTGDGTYSYSWSGQRLDSVGRSETSQSEVAKCKQCEYSFNLKNSK